MSDISSTAVAAADELYFSWPFRLIAYTAAVSYALCAYCVLEVPASAHNALLTVYVVYLFFHTAARMQDNNEDLVTSWLDVLLWHHVTSHWLPGFVAVKAHGYAKSHGDSFREAMNAKLFKRSRTSKHSVAESCVFRLLCAVLATLLFGAVADSLLRGYLDRVFSSWFFTRCLL